MHRAIYNITAYSSPGRADTWFPSLPRKECTGVRYVITKFSRMDGLPNFLTHGAQLARFARRSSALISLVCLVLVRLLLSMAVLYHVNKYMQRAYSEASLFGMELT